MSDRAYMALTIYQCPEDLAAQVSAVLGDYFDGHREPAADVDSFSVDEITLGADDDVVGDLRAALGERFAELTFDLQQEPRYEYLGSRHTQVAGVGYFSAAVTSDGDPVLGFEEVAAVRDSLPALRALFGRDVYDALQPHIDAAHARALAAHKARQRAHA